MLISANSSLDVYGDVERPDDEGDDRPHVGLAEAARGERRRAEADPARVQRALVPWHSVLVHRDAHVFQDPGEEGKQTLIILGSRSTSCWKSPKLSQLEVVSDSVSCTFCS